jgi:hypothetical protein
MCPFCIANVALIAAGTTSTGGLSALLVSRLAGKAQHPTTGNENTEEGEDHGQERQD